MNNSKQQKTCDVVVIGAGPAGLAAATRLKRGGLEKVIVIEREYQAGGVPRHCGHPPFGVIEHKKITAGPSYATRLVNEAEKAGVEILVRSSVTRLAPGPCITVASPNGGFEIIAKKVLLATGTRETPRGARLVSGGRMAGICTTGTLQSMYYLKNMVPFKRPVVIGTEIVSFSALMTCRKAGISVAAMVDENQKPALMWPFYHAAKLFGVPLYTGIELGRISGSDRVESVTIKTKEGRELNLDCDGVLFTGQFTPESSLARMSHLHIDPQSGAPVTDKQYHCSDPHYFAAGNVLQPAKMSVNCWRGGRKAADYILKDISG